MEIKVGDKVRVREDAPKEFERFKGDDMNYEVVRINPSKIIIQHKVGGLYGFTLAIPLKYLIKVEEEKKEAKIKLGDMVRVKGNLHEPFCLDVDLHLEFTNIPPHAVSQKEWKVIRVENRRDCAEHIYTLNRDDSFIHNIPEDCIELVEPTAPTIKVGDNVRNIITGEFGKVLDIQRHVAKVDVVCDWKGRYWDLNNIEVFAPKAEECHYISTEAEKKPNIGSIKIPVKADLTDSYWDTYAADLAKEVVLKAANKFNDPKEAAEYAVKVAKAVVDGLKRK